MPLPLPTTLAEQIEILDLFIECVDELLDSSCLKQTKERGLSTHLSWENGGFLQVSRTGPEHESVKAFLLTVRMFCQNNDIISIGNMKRLVPLLSVTQTLKDDFAQWAADFNQYLDSPPKGIEFSVQDADTRRNIFETFLYGKFAHSTPKKRRRHSQWESTIFEYHDLRMYFDVVLFEFVKVLSAMASHVRLMKNELVSLAGPLSPSKAKSFCNSAEINPSTAEAQLSDIARKIIGVLSSVPHASLEVTLKVESDFLDGVSEQIQHAVSEDAKSLGFKTKSWM